LDSPSKGASKPASKMCWGGDLGILGQKKNSRRNEEGKMFAKSVLGILALAAAALLFTNGPLTEKPVKEKVPMPNDAVPQTAVFAGGCFWCVEANFEKVDGVIEAVSGYTGGHKENPTYREVCSHSTGHLEAVEVTYDANQVSYNDLLEVFWRTFDPTDAGGSFFDRGESYSSAIFVADSEQRKLAQESKERLMKSGRFDADIVTPIRDLETFYPAEDYHQDYYYKNPVHYKGYRIGSGRDRFIAQVWGEDKDYKVVKPEPSVKPEKAMGDTEEVAADTGEMKDELKDEMEMAVE